MTCLLLGLGSLWRFLTAYKENESSVHSPIGSSRHDPGNGALVVLEVRLSYFDSSFFMAGILLVVSNFRSVIHRPTRLHILIAAMLAVSVSIVFLGASPEVLKIMGRNPTLTDRTEVWGVLVGLVKNPLIGTGFDSFWIGPRLAKNVDQILVAP